MHHLPLYISLLLQVNDDDDDDDDDDTLLLLLLLLIFVLPDNFYASAQRSVARAGGILFLSCSSVRPSIHPCVRVCPETLSARYLAEYVTLFLDYCVMYEHMMMSNVNMKRT